MMRGANAGMTALYLAAALVIVAQNRDAIAALFADVRGWYSLRHPRGVLWDDVREAANRPGSEG